MFGFGTKVKSVTVDEVETQNLQPLIDIREVDEFIHGHMPSAQNIPMMGVLMNTEQFLNKETTYYIICETGRRSMEACQVLLKQGYDVVNVAGGTSAYMNKR